MTSVRQILTEYGVANSALSKRECESLDREGYVVLPYLIDAAWLERLKTAFDSEYEKGGRSRAYESGTRHVDDLVNRGAVFEGIYTHPRALAAVHHVLRDEFRVAQVGGRDPLPGYGQQGLHADWTARARGEPFRIVAAICLLDNFTADNGATRVVPGTHHMLNPPPKSFANPSSRHPQQEVIVAHAGSILVFNGHLWHSGTANRSNRSRRVVQCCFVGRDELRFSRIKVNAPDSLSPAARYLLAV